MKKVKSFAIFGLPLLICSLLLTGLSTANAGHTGFRAQTGRLLVADEAIGDPRFTESVILILQHSVTGSVGLVLNNRAELPLQGVPPEIAPGLDHIYFGGPINPQAATVLLFDQKPQGSSKKVLKDIYVTGVEEVLQLIEQGKQVRYRLFLGYASWAPGQLEMELAHGAWRVSPADGHLSEENVEQLWDDLQEGGPVISL